MDNKIKDCVCDYEHNDCNYDSINHVVEQPRITINSRLCLF